MILILYLRPLLVSSEDCEVCVGAVFPKSASTFMSLDGARLLPSERSRYSWAVEEAFGKSRGVRFAR